MVLDHERCDVPGCQLHTGWFKTTDNHRRNQQIREDWVSGKWYVEELASFWGLKPYLIERIVRDRASRI